MDLLPRLLNWLSDILDDLKRNHGTMGKDMEKADARMDKLESRMDEHAVTAEATGVMLKKVDTRLPEFTAGITSVEGRLPRGQSTGDVGPSYSNSTTYLRGSQSTSYFQPGTVSIKGWAPRGLI